MAFRLNVYEQNQANAYRDALEKQRQAEEAQREAYDRALRAQNNAAQAQSRQMNPLESVLSGIVNGVKNVGDTLYNMAGTGIASIRDIGDTIFGGKGVTTKNLDDWQKYAKKTIYGDENLSDKDYYAKTGGKAVDAAATISDLIPVVGQGNALVKGMGKAGITGMNIAQGVASGAVNPLIENGSQATLEDVLRGGIVGGAGATAGQYVGNKLANRVPGTSRLSRIANSNVGRGALTGAASGAVAGGLNAGLTGNDVLQGTLQGAQSGGLGGATMAGTMGVLGKGIQKLQNKYGVNTPASPTVAEAPTRPITQDVVEDTTPAVKASTRRGIPVTDYDSGDQNIRVRRPDTEYSLGRRQGSNIDGILAPDNVRQLPNAKRPNPTIGDYMLGDSNVTRAADAVPRVIDETYGNGFTKPMFDDFFADLDDATRARLAQGVQDAAALNNMAGDEYTVNKSQLPKIKRSDYVKATGYSGKDIPEYMLPYLSEKNGVPLGDGSWSQYMPKYNDGGTFTGTPDDVIQMYDNLANTNKSNANIYNAENVGMALAMDSDLDKAVTDQFLKSGYPTRKIDVKGAPSIADNIDVDTLGGNTAPIKRTIQPKTPAKPNTPITYSDADEPITIRDTKRNPNLSAKDQAKYERQYITAKKAQGDALLAQYGSIDTPTSRSVRNAGKVLSDLYDDYGLVDPADVQYVASRLTGKDGLVTQMTRKLAGTAGDIPSTYSEATLDDLITGEGFSTKERANAVKNQIKSIIGSMNESGKGTANALDVLDMTKKLYDKRAQVLGEDGTYHRATYDDRATARVLKAVAEDYNDRIWENSDISRVLTPENIEVIKSIYPENQKFTAGVENTIAKATNGRELRSTMANFVKAQDIIDNANQIAGTSSAQLARTGVMRGPVKAVAQAVVDKTLNSAPAQRFRAKNAADKAAQADAILNNRQAPKSDSGALGAAKNIAGKAGKKVGNVWDTLNNDTFSGTTFKPLERNGQMQTLGDIANRQLYRQAGIGAMRAQDTERDIQNANIDMQNALQDYNNASNALQQAQTMQQQSADTSQLDRIAQAMNAALTVGDITAYGQLADYYKQALSIYQMMNPTTQEKEKELTQNQTKALTGLQQLQTLSGMSPTAATALSATPLAPVVNMFGGDDYANNAQSLALTLGYLQSGANITPREAEKIGQAYIPTAFDSEAVRRNKLSRAEQLLRNYLGNAAQ